MQQTIIEKIFSEHVGRPVKAGEEVMIVPDLTCMYELPGYVDRFLKMVKEMGITKAPHPERVVIGIDHFYPGGTAEEQEIHKDTWEFVRRFGFQMIDGEGVSHQIICEKYLVPGMIALHHDAHACLFSALGVPLFPMSGEILETMLLEDVELTCPETVRVNFRGRLQRGVCGRDVQMRMLELIGPSGALNACVEMGGEGLKNLSIGDRFTIGNQIMFLGAKTAVFEQDEQTDAYLAKYGRSASKRYAPDPDAVYTKTFEIDLDEVEPMLLVPPTPANTGYVKDYLGRPVDAGLVGSCASGRMEDFEQLLEILDGKKVKEGFRLLCVPSTIGIQKEMAENGVMSRLIDCGARVHYPSCDFCYGKTGALASGETCLADAQINVPGRLGSRLADIFTAGPYAIAAAALTGVITDPRTLLQEGGNDASGN